MARKLAPRIICAVCSTDFPKRGGKRTCSETCRNAYAAQRKKPAPTPEPKPSPMTSMDYIIDRVAVTESGCWEWQQSLNPQTGYGQIGVYPYTAHKLAFFFAHGRYPDGVTRHRCHNRACCNPEHLAEGTYRDNYYDSVEAHRKGREKLLGRAPVNRMPTTVDGVTYPSRTHAMKALGLTWVTLMRLAD